MKISRRTKEWLLAAAISTAAAVAMPALGQQRVGSDGHALDANNRIGSGGYNTAPSDNLNVTPGDVVYGNVTGGRAFSGPVRSTDPRAFTGPIPGGIVDRFVRDSSGSPTPFAPRTDLNVPQPYFGMSRGVAPPTGYVPEGFNGGYVRGDVSPGRTRGDVRLGDPFSGVENITLPQAGESYFAGPVNDQTNNSLITASPLYGIRLWQPGSADNQTSFQNFTTIAADSALPPVNPADVNTAQPASGSQNQQGQQQPLNQQPLQSPLPPLGYTPLPSQNPTNAPLPSGVDSQLGGSYQLLTPAERTPQYQQMHQRLEEFYKSQSLSDARAKQLADQQMKLRLKAKQAQTESQQNQTSTQQPPAATDQKAKTPLLVPNFDKQASEIVQGENKKTQTPTAGESTPPALPSPIKVESLAEGVKTPGLANHLARAEQLMKEGKFSSAIEHYQQAQEISPNNALVLLGRANAELGGGYYAQAAEHLRQAYLADPTIAMGQYDLKEMIGSKRLMQISADLKEIAGKNPKDPSPIFLLSYIAYNTGSPDMAARWLDEANRRAGGHAMVFELLKSHWSLPTTRPAP